VFAKWKKNKQQFSAHPKIKQEKSNASPQKRVQANPPKQKLQNQIRI